MYQGKSIAVVVPAYNEEKLIGRVLETMPDYVDKIVVVDDCSQDDTVERVRGYFENDQFDSRLELISHDENQGVGGAIATGYQHCRELAVDVAAVMAGDAQMAPEDLPALLAPVVSGRADFAKGNRLIYGDAWKYIPKIRYLGNAALSMLTKIASGYWHVADSQTGYTAINQKALRLINWQKMYKRYGQPNDLLVRLNVYNFRVCDVPIQPIYNVGETSGIRPLWMIPKLSWLLFRLFLWRMWQKYVIRDFHPLVFFYTSAFVLLPVGFFWSLYLLSLRLFHGPVAPTSVLFAVFLFLTGVQLILFAMWFDMEYNRDLKVYANPH